MSEKPQFSDYRTNEQLDDSTNDSDLCTSFLEAEDTNLSASVPVTVESQSDNKLVPSETPIDGVRALTPHPSASCSHSVAPVSSTAAHPQSHPLPGSSDSLCTDLSRLFSESGISKDTDRPASQDISNVFLKTGLNTHNPPYSSPSVKYEQGQYKFRTPSPVRRSFPPAVIRSHPQAVLPSVESLLNARPAPSQAQLRRHPVRTQRRPSPIARHTGYQPRPRRKLFNMAPTMLADHKLEFFTDGTEPDDLPKLPPFEWDDHKIDDKPSASLSYKQHLVSQLQSFYDQYEPLLEEVKFSMKDKLSDVQKSHLLFQRARLHTLWHKIRSLIPKVTDIISVQAKNRPTLEDFPDPQAPNPLDYSSMTDYMRHNLTKHDGSPRPLREIWDKLRLFAIEQNISHKSFVTALLSCVTDDVYLFINEYKDLELKKLAKRLANRFVTEQPLLDATNELHAFTRRHNEPLRQSVARLQALVDKVLITHPPAEREVLREHHTISHLRNMIAPKTKASLDARIAEYQTQGLRLKLDDMIKFCSQEEAKSGLPSSDLANPVSLYHVGTTPVYPQAPAAPPTVAETQPFQELSTKVDQIVQNFDHKVDQLTDLISDMSAANAQFCQSLTLGDRYEYEDENDLEVNALTRSNYRQNPQQDAKALTKPVQNTTTTRNRANMQRQNSKNRRDQHTNKLRNIQDNIATQANSIPPQPLTRKAEGVHRSPSSENRPPSRPDTPGTSAQAERGRPRNRQSDAGQVAQRYPSFARDILQYPVTEPKPVPAQLTPADYYKQKSDALQAHLQQPRNRPPSRPPSQHRTPLPPDPDFAQAPTQPAPKYDPRKQTQSLPPGPAPMTTSAYHYPNAPTVVQTYDNTSVTINSPCSFCHSPVPHAIEDCYALKAAFQRLAAKDRERSANKHKPPEN